MLLIIATAVIVTVIGALVLRFCSRTNSKTEARYSRHQSMAHTHTHTQHKCTSLYLHYCCTSLYIFSLCTIPCVISQCRYSEQFQIIRNEAYSTLQGKPGGATVEESEYETPRNFPSSTTSQPASASDEAL